jgi:hypothetical protein
MAKVKESRVTFEAELRGVLADGLRKSGIEATIGFQRVPMTKLVRVMVVSPQFQKMMISERQDLVWRIVSQRFTPDQQLLISMILTLPPDSPAAGSAMTALMEPKGKPRGNAMLALCEKKLKFR